MKTRHLKLSPRFFASTLLGFAAATTALAQPYPSTILADHPTAYWRLQETSGSVATDSAGSDNGTYNNVLLGQTGYNTGSNPSELAVGFGNYAGFGTDSYVTGLNIDLATSSNATFSLEAWVNGSSETQGAGIVGKGYGNGGEEAYLDVGGGSAGAPTFRFFIREANGNAINASATTNYPDGNWHYLVGVCDEVNQRITLYVDGQAVVTSQALGGIKTTTNQFMTIGSRQSSSTSDYNSQFSGEIGEVAVYPYALSAAQIENHYLAAGIGPMITVQPPYVVTGDEGSTVSFSATVVGTAPLYYQWTTNNVAMAGETNSTFVVSNLPYSLNDANVVLVVSNAYGTNSTGGTTLIVNSSAPQLNTNLGPQQLSLYQGQPYTYSVSPIGTEPFSYQWYANGTNIPGATKSSLSITAPAPGTNTYYVIISNSYNGGSTYQSDTSTMTTIPVTSGSYPAAVLADHPVAYWRLGEAEQGGGDAGVTAYDYAGGHNGTYNGVVLGVPGYSAFDFDTACEVGTNTVNYEIGYMQETDNSSQGGPNIASFLQASNVAFTAECWVKCANQPGSDSCILSLGSGGAEAFKISAGGSGGRFQYMARTANGTSTGFIFGPSPDGNWHHLVAVFDEINAGATVFYVDGNLGGTLPAPAGAGVYAPGSTMLAGNNNTAQFSGVIDEIAFYTNALSAAQVIAHYHAAPQAPAFSVVPPLTVTSFVGGSVNLSATESGSLPLTNQWYSNNVALAGQTNVSLNLTNLSAGTNVYTLYVSNAYGWTNTPGTSVQVAAGAGAPSLLVDVSPLTNTLYASLTAKYFVSVSGSLPLSYQWYSNNILVPGATNTSYVISNLTLADAGSYYVAVSNQYSNLVSSTAVLNVVAEPTNPYSLTILNDHPSAYWRLDEPNGSTNGFDYVGGNIGVYSNYNGIKHSTGIFGNGYDADTGAYFNTNTSYTRQNTGSSNYLGTTMTNVDFSVPNGQNGEFSIEAWAKGYPNVVQASGGGILTKGYGNGGEEFNLDVHGGFRFYARTAGGQLAAAANAAPTLGGLTTTSPTNWTMDGAWHHLVGVCDEANDNLLLYVDGNLIGYPVITNGVVPPGVQPLQANHNPSTGTNGALSATAGGGYGIFPANTTNGNATKYFYNSVSIGARNSGSGNTGLTLGFLGAVDEVALYNYCLTPLQVSNHFAVAENLATTITAQSVSNHTVLSWYPFFATGQLQSTTNLASGTWTNIPNATSPYTVTNTGAPAVFYRLKNY